MALTLTTSYAAHPADEETIRVRLPGDQGDLEIKLQDHQLAHRRQTAAFVDACLGHGPVPVTPTEARQVQEIIDELHRSAHGPATTGRSAAGKAAHAAADEAERSLRGQAHANEAAPDACDETVSAAPIETVPAVACETASAAPI